MTVNMSFRIPDATRAELEALAARSSMTEELVDAVHLAYLLALPDEQLLTLYGTFERADVPSISPWGSPRPMWVYSPHPVGLLVSSGWELPVSLPREAAAGTFAVRQRECIVQSHCARLH